jgi:seryl-tRNA(Sec) selenium transferase
MREGWLSDLEYVREKKVALENVMRIARERDLVERYENASQAFSNEEEQSGFCEELWKDIGSGD